jgi:threonine/homoserine/homoserine lactone efflux protein
MSLNIWITYFFATTLILIIPGPTIILVISQAVRHGRKSVVPLATGVVLGDFTAITPNRLPSLWHFYHNLSTLIARHSAKYSFWEELFYFWP